MATDDKHLGPVAAVPPTGAARPRRTRPIFHYLTGAALVTLVPGFFFAGMLIFQNHMAQQATMETLMLASARGVTQAMEREISANITTLRVLAAAPSLREADYRGFHEHSRMALEQTQKSLFIINPDLSTFAYTRSDFDVPLNRTNSVEAAEKAFSTGQVTITDVLLGSVTKKLIYNILQPVDVPGEGTKLIALNQEVTGLSSVISENVLPDGWNAALLDTRNQVLAGTLASGTLGQPFGFPQLAERPSFYRWREVATPEGSMLSVAQRSPTTGWMVVVWAPVWTVFQPLMVSVASLVGGAVLLLVLMVAGLIWFNRGVAESVRGLAKDARRLGKGEEVWARPYPIAEIAEVSQALSDASAQRRAAERDVEFLMREVAHRAKNQMTVITAMAKQTARGAKDIPSYVQAFERRIMGLARSTDLLLAHGRAGVSLMELAESQLEPFAPQDRSRMSIAGPPVRLNVQAAQLLGMALHELATNAVKYGAFAGDSGRLDLTWSCNDTLDVVWRETVPGLQIDGDRVGFGTTVLKAMVGRSLNATVERHVREDGIEWQFAIPVAAIDPEGETATEAAAAQ
jgi:Signal transduction histidine kinase